MLCLKKVTHAGEISLSANFQAGIQILRNVVTKDWHVSMRENLLELVKRHEGIE